MVIKWNNNVSGWWFGTWLLWLPIYWQFHHPNWRTHIFQRDWNHQLDFGCLDPENLELMDFFGFLNGLFMDFAAKVSGFWWCLNRVSTRNLDFGQQALSRKDKDLDWEGAELLQGLASLLKWHTSGTTDGYVSHLTCRI